MLTNKILSSTVGLALTASVAMLAGCPAPTATPTSSDAATTTTTTTTTTTSSASPSASTPAASASAASPAASASAATPASSSSAPPVATNSTQPSGQTGGTADIKERATFNGKAYDPNGVPVDGAKINAVSIDPGVTWQGEEQITANGAFVFRNAPVGARIEITATKDGWTKRLRTEVLKSNLQGDPTANVFDFSGIYAIQDEPEVTILKVNTKTASGAEPGDSFVGNAPLKNKPTIANLNSAAVSANLTGLASDTLQVEMTFSEPVRRDDVQNYFRVASQNFAVKNNSNFSIDQNLADTEFVWSNNDQTVLFRTKKAILANRTGNEARYLVEFTQAFRDKTDKPAKDKRFFRFSPAQINEYHIFSVKNDEQDPQLLAASARDGGSSNDTIELRFSEPMELINQSSVAAGLSDPANPSDTSKQLFAYSTANAGNPATNGNGINNCSVFGYMNAGNNFSASYAIGRIKSARIQAKAPFLEALGGIPQNAPAKVGVTNAKINGNFVLLELTPNAFDRDDRVIVSVGRRIDAKYSDVNNGVAEVSLTAFAPLPANGDFATITDPSGRPMDAGNSTTSANIDVNNAQRVSTAI